MMKQDGFEAVGEEAWNRAEKDQGENIVFGRTTFHLMGRLPCRKNKPVGQVIRGHVLSEVASNVKNASESPNQDAPWDCHICLH